MLDYTNVRDRAILQRIIGAQGGGETTSCSGAGQTFNGTDQYAYVADNGVLDINKASTDFCVCGFAKANASGVNEQYFGKLVNNSAVGRYGFYASSDNVVNLVLQSSGGTVLVSAGIDGDTDTDFHHFLLRVDITNSKIYIYTDGVLKNAGGTAYTGTFATLSNSYKFYLGCCNNKSPIGDPTWLADTQIKDVRVYHKDVTSKLTQLQAGQGLGGEVAWWCLPTLTDLAGSYDLTGVNL